MAGIPGLDREIERLSEEQREYRKQENDAAQLHGRSISENYRKLIEPQQNEPWAEPYAYNTQAYNPAQADPALKTYGVSAPVYPSQNYAPAPEVRRQPAPSQYYQPVYRSDYHEPEYHAPVVPSAPDAPSAAQRLNDYVPIRAGMPLTRMGDMPSYPAQASYASPAAPAAEKKQLFEGLTYQNGELIDNTGTVAPTYDSSYVPAAPAYAPAEAGAYAGTAAPVFEEEDEDDALPTRMTLDAATRAPQRIETVERQENAVVGFFRALSTKAKVALACVAVVVVAMISLICVNTALLNSAEAAVLSRQEQVQVLTERAEELQAQIDRYNSQEYIDQWAQEHGMTRGD